MCPCIKYKHEYGRCLIFRQQDILYTLVAFESHTFLTFCLHGPIKLAHEPKRGGGLIVEVGIMSR